MNINKLKGIMTEKRVTQQKLAEILNLSIQSINRKINTGNFTIKEANIIVDVLQLTQEESTAIFFTQFVA